MVSFKRSMTVLAAIMLLVAGVQPLVAQSSSRAASIRAAQSRGSRIAPVPTRSVRSQQRTAFAQQETQPAPIIGAPNSSTVVGSDPIIGGGSPVISDGYFTEDPVGGVYQGVTGSCMNGGCGQGCGPGVCGVSGCGMPGPANCGYPNCNPCCYPLGQCLFFGLGRLARNTELLAGAQAFRSRSYFDGDQLIDDSSFGFYGGANTIVPMRPITCGLFSGQIGIRSVQSEFDGDNISDERRDQTFVTAGLYRQVDCGLRFGVAYDYLRERWISNADLAQIRGDIGWAWPGGCIFGFRVAAGIEDDETEDVDANDLLFEVVDNYRFYYRMPAINAGYYDVFAGWTEDSHAVLGMDFDVPITPFSALQSGFTYYLPDDQDDPNDPIVQRDAWNVFVGIALRPQGCCWYRNWDRPMFNVADNGSVLIRR